MAQQINLLTPILLAPRRHFSALAMAQAFGLLVLSFALLAGWLSYQAGLARQSHLAGQAQTAAERLSLQTAIAALPAPGDLKAMAQQASDLEQQVQRQRQLAELLGSGMSSEGERHSDLLKLLGSTIPSSVWIHELRWVSGRLELVGATLDTAALRTWLARLAEQPQLAGLRLAQVRVEHWAPAAPGGNAGTDAGASSGGSPLIGTLPPPPPGVSLWAFRVLSERTAAPTAASGVQP